MNYMRRNIDKYRERGRIVEMNIRLTAFKEYLNKKEKSQSTIESYIRYVRNFL